MDYYLYAETAFHHEGDRDYLEKLIEGVAETGANGIKFQVLINAEDFISRKHSAYDTVRSWLFSFEQWAEFFTLARQCGLDIIMMPLDPGAFELLSDFDVTYLELHSVSFYDQAVIEDLKKSGLPVILGAGGRTIEEIQATASGLASPPVLMTGFQAFPSDLRDVKLARIAHLAKVFPESVIGYADHSAYDDPDALTSFEYAYLMGGRCFEKHVTLNEGVQRTDYEAAVSLQKMKAIRERLTRLADLVSEADDASLQMTEAELRYRARQKSVVASRPLSAGSVLVESDICLKMSENENVMNDPNALIGKTLRRSISADDAIKQDDVE